MGRSVNKVTLIGTLGRDPEVRYPAPGRIFAALTGTRTTPAPKPVSKNRFSNGSRQPQWQCRNHDFFGGLPGQACGPCSFMAADM